LELIPGIGKTYMLSIIKEGEKKKFESFADLQSNVIAMVAGVNEMQL
jgi:putative nucleotide binding protein